MGSPVRLSGRCTRGGVTNVGEDAGKGAAELVRAESGPLAEIGVGSAEEGDD
jgi:hypothetical protein